MADEEPFELTSEAAKRLSRLGAAKGGEARANKLSPERRKEIARAAIQARWEKAGKSPLPRATHKGNFKEDFGIDVDCYVLNDDAKTAVISQRGMGQALGLGRVGSRLPRFVRGKAISKFVGPELREKLEQPLIFQAQVGGPETLSQVHGYDVTILIDLCKAITKAESEKQLLPQQANVAKQAHIILNASAKAGIKGLVYALAGYNATREETITAFKLFVQQEAREYEREFPDQLYAEWYRLYNLPKPERNRPWKFMHLTVDQVYRPLAKSNGKILQLTKEQRENSNARWKKLHQFLSEIGIKALRTHLGQLLGIARISKSSRDYETYFKTLFGDQFEIRFPDEPESPRK
jgi:P63C domain